MSCSPSDACELTLDPNTADRRLILSKDNRKAMGWRVGKKQPRQKHPERFKSWPQVLCREGLTGRCYWEVEWEGAVWIGVTYRGITRKGSLDSMLGGNNKSWILNCHDGGYSAMYNSNGTAIPLSSAGSTRVGVYLDQPAGTVFLQSVPRCRRVLRQTDTPPHLPV